MLSRLRRFGTTIIVLTLGFAAISLYCFFESRHKILWSDELFGWVLITDPSFPHMLAAWRGGADGGGIAFYLLCRVWLQLFGHSLLAFRSFSAFGCFAGYTFLWLVLRRYYRPLIATLVLFFVWFGSDVILWQMVQTRFYGMLLGVSCFALYASLRSVWETDGGRRNQPLTLALVGAANLLLVNTHPLGLGYSAALLAGAAVSDFLDSRRRIGFYVAVLATWPTLLFSVAAIRGSARVGDPWFWTGRPTLRDLRLFWIPDVSMARRFNGSCQSVFEWGLLAALIWLGVALICSRRVRGTLSQHSAVLIPAMGLVLTPIAIFAISQRGTSVFVDRYLIPHMVGIAVLLAEALSLLFTEAGARSSTLNRRVGIFALCGLTGFAVWLSLWQYGREVHLPPADFTGELAARFPPGVPVAFVRIDIWDIMIAEGHTQNVQLIHPLDWPLALAPTSPRGMVSACREMENWKRFGYYSYGIEDSQTFLKNTSDFFVVDAPGVPWMGQRILADPEWIAEPAGTLDLPIGRQVFWRVRRRVP
jgi:hypothetical protein